MSLEGAKFICLDEAGNQGEIVLAKGRKFTVGYYVSCDFVLADERAKGVHCEIECDAFGRVTIRNLSPEKPILVNGSAVEIKRILLNNSKLSILDKEYLWLFPKSSSNEFEDLPSEAASTPQKHVGIPEQPPNSCPDFKLHREVPKRFTVHNFAYCIQSDEEGNTSTDSNDDNPNEDITQTNESHKDDGSQIEKDLESNEVINQEQEDNNVLEAKDKNNRSVTPEPTVEEDNTTKGLMETSTLNLINYTKDKTNKSTEKKKKQLLMTCHQSDIVITSFSPRETGVKIEKSFATIMKPKVLVTKTPATPKSAYSTPKGEISCNDVGKDDDKDLMTFHTPSTSKKGTSTASTKVLTNSSMHLIDLTTPHKLRPASPFLKSALKASAKKNVTQNVGDKSQSGKLPSEEQLGLSALPSTPALSEASNSPLETPNSVISVSSSTDSSSIIEVTSDGSNMGITPSSATGPTTPVKAPNLAGACTPKRTPQSLMKRALLTSAKKQNTTPQRNANTTAAGTTTPRREPINRIPLRSNLALLRSPSTPQASTGDKSSSNLPRRHSMSTPTRKSISVISRFDSPSTSTLAPASPSSSTRFSASRRTSLNPITTARALPTSTPVAGSSNNHALRTRAACKTSPLHKVRKSIGGMPLTSHISKARRSIVLPASTSKISSIKEKSPQQVMSGRLVSKARKSLCVTPISARSRNMVTAAKTPPHPPSSILKDRTIQSVRKPEKKAVLFADKKPADSGDVDDLSRTFIIDSDDEENTNNGNPDEKPKDTTFSPEKETKETVSEKETKKKQLAIEIPVDVEEITDLTKENSQSEIENAKENNEILEDNDKKEPIVTEESFADIINDSQKLQEVNKLSETVEIPDSPMESSQTESQENVPDVVEKVIQDHTANEIISKEITKDAITTLAKHNSEQSLVTETGFGEESIAEIIETSNKETKPNGETKKVKEISNKNNRDNEIKLIETSKQNTEEDKMATIETPSSTQDEMITSETIISEIKSVDAQKVDDKIIEVEKKSKTKYKPIVEDITLEGSLIEKEANVSKQHLYEDITLEGSLIEDKVKNEDIEHEATEGVTNAAENAKLLEITEQITKESDISELPKTKEISQEQDIEISNTQTSQCSNIEEKSDPTRNEPKLLKEMKPDNQEVLEESINEPTENTEIIEKAETSAIGDDLENTNKLLEEIEDVLNKSDEIKQKHLIELEEANQESDNPLTEEFDSEKFTQESKEKTEESIPSGSFDKNQQGVSTQSNILSKETDAKSLIPQKIQDNTQTSEKDEKIEQDNNKTEDAENQEEHIRIDIEDNSVSKQEEIVVQAMLKNQNELNIQNENSSKDVKENKESKDMAPQTKENNTFKEESIDSTAQIESDVNEYELCKTGIVQNEEVADIIIFSTEKIIINEENYSDANTQSRTEALEIVEECEKNKENLEEVVVNEESLNTQKKTEVSEIDIDSEKDVEKLETSIQTLDNVISKIEDSNRNKESSEILSHGTIAENEIEIVQDNSTDLVTDNMKNNEKSEEEVEAKLENVVSETEDSSKEKEFEEKSEEKIAEISVREKDETVEAQTALDAQNENQTEVFNVERVQKENVSQVTDKASDIKPKEQSDISKEYEEEISSLKKKNENSASFTPRRSTRRASQSAETSQASTELSFTPRRSARRASMSAESTTTYTPTKRTTRRASLSVVNEMPLTPKAITKRRSSISLDNDEIFKSSTSKTPRAKTPRKQMEQRMVITEEMEEIGNAAIIEEVEEPAEEVLEIGRNKRRSSISNNATSSTLETPLRKEFEKSVVIPEENIEIVENEAKQQNREVHSLGNVSSAELKEEVAESSTKISQENVKNVQNIISSEDKKPNDAEGSNHQTENNKTEPGVVTDKSRSSKKEEESINTSGEKTENELKENDEVDKVNLKDNIIADEETSKEHIEKSMESKDLIEKDLAKLADDKEEHQQKTPTKQITIETEISDINTPVAKKSVTIIAESPKTPLMSGMRELLKTPKTEVQTPRLEGIRNLVRSPKETQENEEEEIEKLAVVADLIKTPKTTSSETVLEQETLTPKTKKQINILADSPKTPLMSGMRELLKTPKTEVGTPRLVGIRDLVRSPRDTNENEEEEIEKLAVVADLIKTHKVPPEDKEISTPKAKKNVIIEAISPQTPLMAGMRELLKTPKCEINTPKLEGIRDLVKTPKSKTENEQEETEKLAVVAELVKTPQVEVEQIPSSSHNNDNLKGVKELLKTPKSCNTPRFKGMRELMQTPKLSSTPLMAGVKELLDSPIAKENSKYVLQEYTEELPCSTANKTGLNLKGVKELMKTPKICSTPRLKGVRELMQTPKMSSTPLMGGLKELMNSPAQNKEEELNKYLRTPTAKNIMIPTMPSSAVIEKSSDSIEISTEYDLNATNEGETANLEDLFKTPVASRFAERITASYYGEDDEKHDETLEKFNENKNETLQDTLSKSAEEAFDKLVGQETQIQTPIRKVYPRKSFALQTPQAQSPFTAADVLSDLPKTDVEEWIETLDQAEPPSILECDVEGEDEQKNEENVDDDDLATESLKVDDDEDNSVLEKSLCEKDTQDITANESVIPETYTKVYLPEKSLGNNTTASLSNSDTKDPLKNTNLKPEKEKDKRPVTPIDAEISGINLLDQTVESVQDEPSILDEPLIVEEPSILEEPLMVSDNESEADKTLHKDEETEVLEVSQDDANDLSEPLMVSDSEDLNQSQEHEINKEIETKEREVEKSNLDVEKSITYKNLNITLSEDPLENEDKEPESSSILVEDEKSLIEINKSKIQQQKNADAEILSTSQESLVETDILGEESLQLEDSPTKVTIKDNQQETNVSLTIQSKDNLELEHAQANEDLEAEVDAAETVVIVEDTPTVKIENQEVKEISIKETKVLSNESDDIFVDTSVTEIFQETTATNDENTAESHEVTESIKQNNENDIEKEVIKKSSPQLNHECQDIFMDSSNIDESFADEETNVEIKSAKPETSTEISKHNSSVAVIAGKDVINKNQTIDSTEKTSDIDNIAEKQQINSEKEASQSKSDSESVITRENQSKICEQSSLISEEIEQIPTETVTTSDKLAEILDEQKTEDIEISTSETKELQQRSVLASSEVDNEIHESIKSVEPIEEDKTQENIASEPLTKSSYELNEQPFQTIMHDSSISNEEMSQLKSENNRIKKDDTISNKKDEIKQTYLVPSSTEKVNVTKTEQKTVISLSTEDSKLLLPKHEEITSSDLEVKEGTSEPIEKVSSIKSEESEKSARNDSEESASIAFTMEGTTAEEEIVYDTEVVTSTEEQSIDTEKELSKEIEQSGGTIMEDKATTAKKVITELEGEIVSLTEEESKETAIASRDEFVESASIALEEKGITKEEIFVSDKTDVKIIPSTAEESKEIKQKSINESGNSVSLVMKVGETSTVEAVIEPSGLVNLNEVESKEADQVTPNESEQSSSIILKVEETASEEVSTNESEVSDSITLEVEVIAAEKCILKPEEEVPSTVKEPKLAEKESVIESEDSNVVVSKAEETASERNKLAERESIIESQVSGAVVLEVEEATSDNVSSTVDECKKVSTNESGELYVIFEAKENATEETAIREKISKENETMKDSKPIEEVTLSRSEELPSAALKVKDYSTEEKVDIKISEEKDFPKHGKEVSSTAEESTVESTGVLLTIEESKNKNENLKFDEIVTSTAVENKDNESTISKESVSPTEIVKSYDFEIKINDTENQKEAEDINRKDATSQRKRKGSPSTEASSANVEIPLRQEKLEEEETIEFTCQAEVESPEYEKIEKVEKTIITTEEIPRSSRRKRTVSESSQDSAQGDEHSSSSRRNRRKVIKNTKGEKLEDVKEEKILQLEKVNDEKPKRKRTTSESSQGSVYDDDISGTTRRTRRRVQKVPVKETVVEQKEEIEELIPKDTQVPSPNKQKENNINLIIETTRNVEAESTADVVTIEQEENISTDVKSTEELKSDVAELVDNKQEDVTQVTVGVQEHANENQDENKEEEVKIEVATESSNVQSTPVDDVSEDNIVQTSATETKEDLIEVQPTKMDEIDTQSSEISEVKDDKSKTKEEKESQYTETPALKVEANEAKEGGTKSMLSDIIEMSEALNTESITENLQEVEDIAVDEPKELPVKRGRRKPTISESSQGSVYDDEPTTHIRKTRRKVQKVPVEEVVLEESPTDREHNTVAVPEVEEKVLPPTEEKKDLETKILTNAKDSENITTTVSEVVTLEEVKEQTIKRGRRKPTVSESSQGSVHEDDSLRTRIGRRKLQKAPIGDIISEENETQVSSQQSKKVEIKEPEATEEEADAKEESKQILIAIEEQKVEEMKEMFKETEEHKFITEKTEFKEVEAAVVEEVIEEHEDVTKKTELKVVVVEATVLEEVKGISNEQVAVSIEENFSPESHNEISVLESIKKIEKENVESKTQNEIQQEIPEIVVKDHAEDEESKEAIVKRTRRKRDLKDIALEEPTTSRKARRINQTANTADTESIVESAVTKEVPEAKLTTFDDIKVNVEPVVETADERKLDEVSATSNKEDQHEDEISTKHVSKRGRHKFELEEISNETTERAKETIHATRRGGRHKTVVSESSTTEIPKVRNTTRARKTPLEKSSEISNDEELTLINENIPEVQTPEDIPKVRNTSRNRKTPIDHPNIAVQKEDQKESIKETPTILEVPKTIADIEKPNTDNVVIIEDSSDEDKPSNDKLANSPEEEYSVDGESKDDDKLNIKHVKRNRTAFEINKDLVIDVKHPKQRAKQQAEEVHEENQNKTNEPQVTEVSNEKEVAEKPLKTSRRRGVATNNEHHEEEHHEKLPTKSRRRRARHDDSEDHHVIEIVNEPIKPVEEPSVSEVKITEVNLEPEEIVEKTNSPQNEKTTGRRGRRNVTNEGHHLDESETKRRAAAKHIEQDNEENTATSRRRVGRRKHVGEEHEGEEPVTHKETAHKRRNIGRRKQEHEIEDHHDDITSEEGKQHEAPDIEISQHNIDKDKQDHDDNEASIAKHVAEEEIKHVEIIETTSKRRHISRKKHDELEDRHIHPKHDTEEEQQHIENTDITTKRHVGRKKHDTETHHEKDNVADIISVDIENQTEHSPEETKKVRGRRKKNDHPEEQEVTTSLSPKTKHRGRKRKESHNDAHEIPIEKEQPVPDEKSNKEPEMKLDIVSAHSETPQRAASRGRKATAIEHITSESHDVEDTPGRRARNVPQRRAATAYHNYDETSDSEVKARTTKKKTESPRKSLEATKTSPTATITSAPVINASPSPSSTASVTTARGRTRKPTAKVQQFLEEERAKAETPKKRGLLAAATSVDSATTPQRTPARRGRKASTLETEIEGTPLATKGRGRGKHTVTTITHAKEEHGDEHKHEPEATAVVVEEKEVELHTTPPQAHPAAKGRRGRKAKINEDEHQKCDEPPAKKSPLELEIEKQNSSPSVDAPTPPTRVAGRRNAAAAAKARIEEDALAAAAIDPPKRARARKAPTKVSTPIISATPDTEVHSSEIEDEKVTKSKSSPSKGEHRLASASTLEGAEDLEDHIENESTDKPANKRVRKAIANINTDSPAVPVKRSRKAKTAEEATETNIEEDTKPTRGRGRGRKNVHFDEHGEEPATTATTSSHQNNPDIETPVVVESSEPVKRGTRTRRK
ncbi:uncharacterized protein ACRADG_010465 isoform 2-T2 [Cochliomyia hominivorax]